MPRPVVESTTVMPNKPRESPANQDPLRWRARQKAMLGALLWALAVAIAAALFGLNVLLERINSQHRGVPTLLQAGGEVMCLTVLVIFARRIIEIEHHLRGQRPEARALDAAHAARRQYHGPGRARRRRRGRFAPLAITLFFLLESGAAIGFVVLAISSHAADARSDDVQHHGIRTSGTVRLVKSNQICNPDPRSVNLPCLSSANVRVALTSPKDGVGTTTVHESGASDLRAGDRISVLLDPRQPDYAELPGRPYRGPDGWLAVAFIAAFFLVLACLEGRSLARVLTLRSRHRDTFLAGRSGAATG